MLKPYLFQSGRSGIHLHSATFHSDSHTHSLCRLTLRRVTLLALPTNSSTALPRSSPAESSPAQPSPAEPKPKRLSTRGTNLASPGLRPHPSQTLRQGSLPSISEVIPPRSVLSATRVTHSSCQSPDSLYCCSLARGLYHHPIPSSLSLIYRHFVPVVLFTCSNQFSVSVPLTLFLVTCTISPFTVIPLPGCSPLSVPSPHSQ